VSQSARHPIFRTILVGFDGSARAEDALELSELLARVAGAHLVAACVHAPPTYGHASGRVENGLREQAERTVDQAQRAGVEMRTRTIADDSPAAGLLRIAEQEHADMIVVGSSHRGTFGRVLPGSVPELLLHTASCPIAVAPYGYATGDEHQLRRIGVAFDAGPESRVALSIAGQLARRARAHVTVIGIAGAHAATLVASPLAAMHYPGYVDRIRDDEEQLVKRAADSLEGVASTPEPHLGSPGPTLATISGELDLLVLGSRSYGLLRRVIAGSVSTKLVRDAACPLLIAPRGRRAPSPTAEVQAAARAAVL
jgi:nucleotide-binding universal stress UspA family protein